MGGSCRRQAAPAAGQPGPAAPAPPPPDPVDIAYRLTFALNWTSPVPQTAPGWRRGHTITGITTWLWVDHLSQLRASVTVRGLTVVVTATPTTTTWDLTEATVQCDDLGHRYEPGQTPTCAHAFRHRSTDRGGDGRYPALVRVSWDVRWRSSDGRSGRFGRATTAARFRIAVTGAEAVTD